MTVELHRLVWGPDRPMRVLLVHGVTSSAQVWWKVASTLLDHGVGSVAVDLRGHGASPRTASYRLSEFAADLEWFVGREGPFDLLVGHSLGGAALAVAATGDTPRCLIDPPVVTDDLTGFAEAMLAEAEPTIEGVAAANPRWHPEDVEWKVRSTHAVTRPTLERWLADCLPWDISGDLGATDVPTRVIVADPAAGGLIAEARLPELERNPAITVERARGVGHSVQRDDADLVVRAILSDLGVSGQ